MTNIRIFVSRAVAVTLAISLAGCWIDENGSGSTTAPVGGSAATLSGTVYAAAVTGASVSAFATDALGAQTGAALATATTDANGGYSLGLTTVPTGPVLVVATGGTYTSEADQTSQTLGSLSTLVASVAAGSNTVQVNVLTNTIAAAAHNLLVASGGSVASAVGTATTQLETLFGVSALTASPQVTATDPVATSGDGWLLAAFAGTLEQLRANSSLTPADLYKALQDDAADGKLDGKANGQPITIGASGPTLQASLFTTQWSGAANAYGTAHTTYAAATTTISAALQTSAQSSGVAIGSSGSIAPLVTQAAGTQIYFAARTDGLVQLDMSDPAHATATKIAAINSAVMLDNSVSPPTGYFSSLDGIVINPTPVNTASGAKVFALLYSYRSKTVVSVNLTDGIVAGSAALTIVNSSGFSGATASVAGGIADGKRGKIWLATGDGLLGLDPSDLTITPIAIAQPPNTEIIENIGGDPAKDIIFSPDYDNRSLVIFNLAEAKAYVMDTTTWQTAVGSFASGSEVDGVALDSVYNVAVMNLEGGSQIGVMAYATPSGATTAIGALTTVPTFKSFTAPAGSFSGSAIDAVSHTALFVGEGRSLGVGVLDDPTSATWAGFSNFISAGSSIYSFEPHDPHTVGAFNVLGKPYGFVLQGSGPYQVVVLDLNAWLAAPSTGGVLATDPLTNTSVAQLLSY